ncbi:MAG TPA: IclR family transcriptional regulator [Brevibacterium sp.]|nr:IclR family transcriptional regulator [Brevibacterium sp.]
MRKEVAGPARIESVRKALSLLDLIAEEGALTVTDAALALDVHQSTAQRLLATLVEGGYARQDARRRYVPGQAMFRVPQQVESARQRLRPFVEQLFERVGETIHLATLVGTEVHHPDAIESRHPLRFGLRTGVRLPAHITSEGKSLLAELPWEEVESRYSLALSGGRGWDVDLDVLRRKLDEVRVQGYATNFEESEPGIAAYAMSIGVIDGERCAFSIAMPISRHTPDLGASFVADLRQVVEAARAMLGVAPIEVTPR